jgi:phage/plasmid-associated DNA primase
MPRAHASVYRALRPVLDTELENRLPDLSVTYRDTVDCSIQRDGYSKFYDIYCKAAYAAVNDDDDVPLLITQLPKETMPFVVRFNFRFEGFTERQNLISDRGLAAITQAIQNYLSNTFEFDHINNYDACIILLSDVLHVSRVVGHDSKDYSTFSAMFHFPMCRINRDQLQRKYVTELTELLQEAWPRGKGVFEVTPVARDWEKMLDKRIYKQGLPYYGSAFSEDDAFLKFYRAYTTLDVVTKTYDFTEQILDDSDFEPECHTKVEQRKIKKKELFDREEAMPEWYWLPLILSIDYWSWLTSEIDHAKRVRERRCRQEKAYMLEDLIRKSTNVVVEKRKTLDRLYQFISMWDVNRVLDRREANYIGEAFYDIMKGEPTGLLHWISVLKQAMADPRNKQHYFTSRNVRRKCEEAYNSFSRHNVTIDTVEHYAAIDSPDKYDEFQDGWCSRTKPGVLSGIEGDVAKDFRREFPLKYVCSHNGSKVQWYIYSNHRYKLDHGGLSIKKCMSTHYLLKIQKLRDDIKKQLEGEVSADVGDLIVGKADKLLRSLRTQAFKRKLLDALVEEYKNPHFQARLDQNPEVLGTPNAVIAATDSDIRCRDGKPEDYITKSCRVSYHREYSWDHPVVDEAMTWAKKTFIDPETIDFFWRYLASILRGRNNDKKLMLWSGKRGNNSKSMWVRAMSCVLGEYFTKIPMNLLTQGRGKANDASAVEAATDGCRFVVAEEPSDSVPLLSEIIKSETGDDDKIVRELYSAPRMQVPMHKLAVICNAVPVMEAEPAMEERVVVCPFESQWKNNAAKTLKEQFARREFRVDPFFNKKIPSIAPGIMWIMYNYYDKYINQGISSQPPEVIAITKKYWDANDRYLKFITENIEKGDKSDKIEAPDMWLRFSRWHFLSYRKLEVPDKYKALEELEKKKYLDTMIAGCWSGIRLKEKA